MVKIQPISDITVSKSLKSRAVEKINNIPENKITNPVHSVKAVLGAGIAGGVISSFLQNFNKTISEEENYFQLKTDPATGNHFKPDIFQTAAGMNLFLGNDVLVTAPTGTGKTAIAEYIITKNLHDGGRTFYTTPLKALSNEKFLDFSKTYGEENVGLLTGDTKINTDAPVVIMTTEVYRNMAASGYFNPDKKSSNGINSNLKTVIFDELQYLGDVDRGGIWEQSLMFTPKDVQILSLSATIGNNEEINNWIASIKHRKGTSVSPKEGYLPNKTAGKETVLIDVPSKNRHVPLYFEVESVAANIKNAKGRSKKEKIKARREGVVDAQTIYAKPARDAYKYLTKSLKKNNKLPAIYFVFSKKESRKLLNYLSLEGEILTTKEERTEIENIIKKYKKSGIYLGESLNIDALKMGYATHNAGLLPSQKRLIEELFQKKIIKVVLATETLSAGINMPAKTTVISSPRKPSSVSDGGSDYKRNLSPNEFHQMAGRAGRRGIDTEGFCVPLSCNNAQRKLFEDLISQPSNPLQSNLDIDYSFIANYTSENFNDDILESILKKSFFVNNPNGGINKGKLNEIMNRYKVRHNIMKDENFIDNDGNLTVKGELIKSLNGYEQIPIINILDKKILNNLNEIQLAGIIGGLANIGYNTKGDDGDKGLSITNTVDLDFIEAAKQTYYEVKDYERKSSALHPERELDLDGSVIEHLYLWAELNSHHGNSRDNWQRIYKDSARFSIKDEGSLFKEITMTIDLMKQLREVAQKGELYSKTSEDVEYYTNLGEKLNAAISLLQQEPITHDSLG